MNTTHYLMINDSQSIEGLQEEFNSAFPYLKIEFFKERHRPGIGTEKKSMYNDTHEKMFNLQSAPKQGKIALDASHTVQQLEAEFEEKFGLYIQVFRKSGSIWLETSKTDNWTLEQQNEEGRSLQEELKTEKESPDDHDIW